MGDLSDTAVGVEVPVAVTDRQRRYSTRVVVQARELYASGLGPTEVRRRLAVVVDGPAPALATIRNWVIPGHAESHRTWNTATYRRRRARNGEPMWSSGVLAEDALDARMVELRAMGMSYPAIAAVVNRYHGAQLTGERVRYRLRARGVAPMAVKSAVMRRQWADQRAAA